MTKKRFASVDVLRGMAITIMILGDVFPDGEHIYFQLTHRPWEGINLMDTAFPAFLFLVGVSSAFSRTVPGNPGWLSRAIKRSGLLFALGLLLNQAFGIAGWLFNPEVTFSMLINNIIETGRPLGVLQRIAMAYLGGMIIIRLLPSVKALVITTATLLLASSAGYHLFNPAAPFDEATCISSFVDQYILGSAHCYMQASFDPEGLYGLVNSTATMLIGYMTGKLLDTSQHRLLLIKQLAIYGLLLLLAEYMWSCFDIISKPLWTSPYVLLMAGTDMLMIAIIELALLAPCRIFSQILHPVQALGQNPIFFYLLNDSLMVLLTSITVSQSSLYSWLWHSTLYPENIQLIGPCALFFSMLMISLYLLLAELLYHHHIVIKL